MNDDSGRVIWFYEYHQHVIAVHDVAGGVWTFGRGGAVDVDLTDDGAWIQPYVETAVVVFLQGVSDIGRWEEGCDSIRVSFWGLIIPWRRHVVKGFALNKPSPEIQLYMGVEWLWKMAIAAFTDTVVTISRVRSPFFKRVRVTVANSREE